MTIDATTVVRTVHKLFTDTHWTKGRLQGVVSAEDSPTGRKRVFCAIGGLRAVVLDKVEHGEADELEFDDTPGLAYRQALYSLVQGIHVTTDNEYLKERSGDRIAVYGTALLAADVGDRIGALTQHELRKERDTFAAVQEFEDVVIKWNDSDATERENVLDALRNALNYIPATIEA